MRSTTYAEKYPRNEPRKVIRSKVLMFSSHTTLGGALCFTLVSHALAAFSQWLSLAADARRNLLAKEVTLTPWEDGAPEYVPFNAYSSASLRVTFTAEKCE
ncbi:hypothetical protein PoB_003292100 [Plakobranchus ocellatus]|uniref:Uncharacterized protein n=1 Tax=Plakobranchus ocellatus TaxID=259542 RepID=A0AAV4A5A8_9GAST|nr:hypothetical protein PoB_003292100 [Plakobranchus ocellatus]